MRDHNKRAIKTYGVYTPYVEEKEAYENLANAIIINAAHDYIKACKRYKRSRSYKARLQAYDMMQECLTFFRSQWFGVLTDIDPEELIKRLREECR